MWKYNILAAIEKIKPVKLDQCKVTICHYIMAKIHRSQQNLLSSFANNTLLFCCMMDRVRSSLDLDYGPLISN